MSVNQECKVLLVVSLAHVTTAVTITFPYRFNINKQIQTVNNVFCSQNNVLPLIITIKIYTFKRSMLQDAVNCQNKNVYVCLISSELVFFSQRVKG